MSEELNTEALTAEVSAILTEGGALQAHASYNGAWLVSASFPCPGYADDGQGGMSGAVGPKAYAGDTRRTNADPRELAASFVADAHAHAQKMEAFFSAAQALEHGALDAGAAESSAAPQPEAEVQADDDAPAEPLAEDANPFEDVGASPLDAEFEEMARAGASEFPELGADILAAEAEAAGAGGDDTGDQARFYGLDDLDRVRRLRIGDVATAAALRIAAIEAAAQEGEGEYQTLQTFVVTNLDKFTGAFTLQDLASVGSYRRFVELDTARSAVRAIDDVRKTKTAFLLTASREEVIGFDPEHGWPEQSTQGDIAP